MGISYGPTLTIVPGIASVATSRPVLHLSLSSSGGNLGGNYSHVVTSKGNVLYSGGPNRSYRVSSYGINSSTGAYVNVSNAALDVYGSTTDATAMNTFLNNMKIGELLVMTTYDEPSNNSNYFNTNLISNFGATLINNLAFRYCYLLVAVKGKGVIYEDFATDTQYRAVTMWLGFL
jgi:hypothetical protein